MCTKERDVFINQLLIGPLQSCNEELFEACDCEKKGQPFYILESRELPGQARGAVDRIEKNSLSYLWQDSTERLVIGYRTRGNNALSSPRRLVNILKAKA